ncbi:MAG: RNA polymerase sigma factor [Bacteriovoracia bacterium]
MSFARQVDHVGMRKKLATIATIGESQISRVERERLFVHTALSYLPTRARTILFLRFWQDSSFCEIADALNLPMRLVRVLFFLSLTYLERELRPYIIEPEDFIRGYIKVS